MVSWTWKQLSERSYRRGTGPLRLVLFELWITRADDADYAEKTMRRTHPRQLDRTGRNSFKPLQPRRASATGCRCG
jgi:hypothetical protein